MPYSPENNPYIPGDPYSYDLKWLVQNIKRLQSALEQLEKSYTTPTVIDTAAEMRDVNKIYVYVGSEPGYSLNHWYYYDPDTNLWTDGGAYGALDIDTALSNTSSNAVRNSVITNALALKQDKLTLPLSVSNGGTGRSSAPSLLTDLASTTASSPLTASPRPGITGTLPVSHGGTGQTSAPSLLTDLASTTAASPYGATPRPGITGTLPINHGGTNATDAATARTNFDIYQAKFSLDGSPISLNVPNNSRHVLFIGGAATVRHEIIIVGCGSTGTVTQSRVFNAANITSTTSTNTITIDAGSGSCSILAFSLGTKLLTEIV